MSNYNRAINLRPWRDELKEIEQKNFNQLTLFVVLLSLLISLLLWNNLTSSLDNINAENQIIETHLKALKAEIKEIAGLKEQRQALISNLNIIQELQSKRYATHLIYTSLVESINSGIQYTAVERKQNKLIIIGKANLPQSVSELMRNLAKQPSFSEPELTRLVTDEVTGLSEFNLSLAIKEVK